MFRNIYKVSSNSRLIFSPFHRQFLSNAYKCNEIWESINSSPVLNKINLNDFYNKLYQTHSSKGIISAIDVDIFANSLNDALHLEELKDLLHKLRLSAETGNMLESTPHATIRNFIKFNYIDELIEMLKDPLNFGLFLDDYSANMLLNELIIKKNYSKAAEVASLIMLQEDNNNEITCSLCKYASYKFIQGYTEPEPTPAEPEAKNLKVEEIKIRVKFLRNPYFDDHFDLKDKVLLAGKTLAWLSQATDDNLNSNLKILGWMYYKKYDKLHSVCQELSSSKTFKMYDETIELLKKNIDKLDPESQTLVEKTLSELSKVEKLPAENTLEKSLTTTIENAINKIQKKDIESQEKLFKQWVNIRQEKLNEQTQRLDRAKRMQEMKQKQEELQVEEQKLWFFENEEKIDLEIEEKEKLVDTSSKTKQSEKNTIDENYVPPEIIPKRR